MKDKFKTLFIDGILFLLPVIFMIYLFKILFGIILDIMPFDRIFPEDSILGPGFKNLIALIIILILVIICGLLSRSFLGTMIVNTLNGLVSKVVPGFSIIKQLFYEQKGDYDSSKIQPSLALIDDAWLFAFILEEKNDAGLITVYVPSAPIPTSGNVYLMKEEQLKRLDITVKETIKCITQLGIGSKEILKGKIH